MQCGGKRVMLMGHFLIQKFGPKKHLMCQKMSHFNL